MTIITRRKRKEKIAKAKMREGGKVIFGSLSITYDGCLREPYGRGLNTAY